METYKIKVKTINKRWEAKRADTTKDPKVQGHNIDKEEDKSPTITNMSKQKNQSITGTFERPKEKQRVCLLRYPLCLQLICYHFYLRLQLRFPYQSF